jgi:plasmanylethanolamine desaturase
MKAPQIVQADAKELEGTAPFHRRLEILSIAAFFAMLFFLGRQLSPWCFAHPLQAIAVFFLGWVFSDFLSGFVHWAADTWGTHQWFIVGPAFIRPFREHHVNQFSITRHDFIETNGNNCMVTLPFVLATYFLPEEVLSWRTDIFKVFMFSTSFFVFLTNQMHKWSHEEEVSPLMRMLMKLWIVLPKEHHAIHHNAPFEKYYCITSGWLNYPLYKLNFFRRLERLIYKVTDAVPRENDIGREAALAIMNGHIALPSKVSPKSDQLRAIAGS